MEGVVSIPERFVGSYVSGIIFAGYYFTQTRPDWRDRLVDMAVYSVVWPINMAKDAVETINMVLF